MEPFLLTGIGIIIALLLFITFQNKKIVMTNEELVSAMAAMKTALTAAATNITAKMAALQSAITASDTVPDTVVQAFNDLQTEAAALENIVPPAPAAPAA